MDIDKIIKKIANIIAVLFAFYLVVAVWVIDSFFVAIMVAIPAFIIVAGFCTINTWWNTDYDPKDNGRRRRRMIPFRRDWNDPYS